MRFKTKFYCMLCCCCLLWSFSFRFAPVQSIHSSFFKWFFHVEALPFWLSLCVFVLVSCNNRLATFLSILLLSLSHPGLLLSLLSFRWLSSLFLILLFRSVFFSYRWFGVAHRCCRGAIVVVAIIIVVFVIFHSFIMFYELTLDVLLSTTWNSNKCLMEFLLKAKMHGQRVAHGGFGRCVLLHIVPCTVGMYIEFDTFNACYLSIARK